jgi:pimeloyl-ACP methyl ester carboxylesterase
MVTYDQRGHGNSDKPLEPEHYKDSKAWADELQAVMDATGIKLPVLADTSLSEWLLAKNSAQTWSAEVFRTSHTTSAGGDSRCQQQSDMAF